MCYTCTTLLQCPLLMEALLKVDMWTTEGAVYCNVFRVWIVVMNARSLMNIHVDNKVLFGSGLKDEYSWEQTLNMT